MGMFLTKLCVEEVSKTDWKLTCDLKYLRSSGEEIIVPAGFVTDFASVPKFATLAYALFKDEGRRAAVVHDYYYRVAGKTKEEADILFLGALRDLPDVPLWKIGCMYYAVRFFGIFSWRESAKRRSSALVSAINPANRNVK